MKRGSKGMIWPSCYESNCSVFRNLLCVIIERQGGCGKGEPVLYGVNLF